MKLHHWIGIFLATAVVQAQAKEPEARVYNASSGEQVIIATNHAGGTLLQIKNSKSILNNLVLPYSAEPFDAEVNFHTTVYGRKYITLMATYDYDEPFQVSEVLLNLPESEQTLKLVYSEADSANVKLADLAKLEKSQANQIQALSSFDFDKAKWLEDKKLPQFGFVRKKMKKLEAECGDDVALRYDWEQARPEMLKDIDWSPARFVGGGIDGLTRTCDEQEDLKDKVAKVDNLVVQPAAKSALKFSGDTLYFSAQFDNKDGLEEYFISDNIASTLK